jgi:MGT family glycosyltransferase
MALRLFTRTLPGIARYRRAVRKFALNHDFTLPPFPRILNWPGDSNIVYSSRRMMPDGGRFGEEYAFVGPAIGPRLDAPAFPLHELDPGRALIYISLGTVFNDNLGFFHQCIAAFGGGERQVVLSVGRERVLGSLGQIPDNIITRAYVPQLEILERAALFVTHAGVNSVHESLYHSVPLLLVPQQMEQTLVAARVAELGAGLALPRRGNEATLQAFADRLLREPSFHTKADELSGTLRKAGGVPRAAKVVERAGGGDFQPAGSSS